MRRADNLVKAQDDCKIGKMGLSSEIKFYVQNSIERLGINTSFTGKVWTVDRKLHDLVEACGGERWQCKEIGPTEKIKRQVNICFI